MDITKRDVIHLFGDRLRELRKNNNLTQEEFGNLFNVAKNTVSYWEANTSKPDIDLLKKIAEYFGVSTDYLLGFNQDNLDKAEKLRIALKEAGVMVGTDLSIDELNRVMRIVEMMKEEDAKK